MELYKHQKEIIQKAKPILEVYNLAYIVAETRTGKTLATICLLKDDYENILVVTKKKAISSWLSDLKLAKAENFEVINYESIHKIPQIDYDVIVIDEAHSIGSYPKPSKRAKDLKQIAKGKKIVYLSATPTAETYSQIFHQLWVSSYSPFTEKNFYNWYRKYGVDDSIMIHGRMIKRYKESKEDLIMPMIEHLMIKMTKEKANFKVLVKEQKHIVKPKDELQELSKYFEKHKVISIRNETITAETPPDLLSKLHQISGGTIKASDEVSFFLSLHKVEYIKKNLSKSNKIVILCNYIKERQLLLAYLENSTDDVKKFKEDDYKYFIGHIKTFSEGVDFSYADTMIIYSLNFSATTYLQSKERLANKKRSKAIVVHYLLTLNSIDDYIYEAVSNKINFTNSYYRGLK